MQQIHKITGRLSCIPNNTEKYISFSIGQLKFLDSFQFMGSSQPKLVDATDKDDFKITQNSFNPHPIKKKDFTVPWVLKIQDLLFYVNLSTNKN